MSPRVQMDRFSERSKTKHIPARTDYPGFYFIPHPFRFRRGFASSLVQIRRPWAADYSSFGRTSPRNYGNGRRSSLLSLSGGVGGGVGGLREKARKWAASADDIADFLPTWGFALKEQAKEEIPLAIDIEVREKEGNKNLTERRGVRRSLRLSRKRRKYDAMRILPKGGH